MRLVLAAMLLVACTEPAPSATSATVEGSPTTTVSPTAPTTATTVATAPSTTVPAPDIPAGLVGFELTNVRLDGRELLVAVADTGELRRRGLMNVAALGDLDGMLFVFPADTTGGFWMKDTLLPLDIAFFASDGTFVDGFPMEPCTTAECPTYRPSGSYRYALEVLQGEMPGQVEMLELTPAPSP